MSNNSKTLFSKIKFSELKEYSLKKYTQFITIHKKLIDYSVFKQFLMNTYQILKEANNVLVLQSCFFFFRKGIRFREEGLFRPLT